MRQEHVFQSALTIILVFCSFSNVADDPKELLTIKGFSAGMDLAQVVQAISNVASFF